MRSGPLASTLFGLALVACGRANLVPSAGSTNDAGNAPDATSMSSVLDASVPKATEVRDADDITDAGDTFQDDAYAPPPGCTVPATAHSIATCQLVPNQGPGSPSCNRPTEYGLFCSEALDASSVGCALSFIEEAPRRGWAYCCFCEGTDAATGCVNVDLSTYDRSCSKGSDCMVIQSGMRCPGDCDCCGGNAAINVDGQARYEQTTAPLSSQWILARGLPASVCNCPSCAGSPGPFCVHGLCSLNQ